MGGAWAGLKNTREITEIPEYAKNKKAPGDTFFTDRKVAKEECYDVFRKEMRKHKVALDKRHFIEPSSGEGCFYDVLPKKRRTALDIAPRREYVKKKDFLRWYPKNERKEYVVIGNPPFGVRGACALAFIKRSFLFADIVAFILPNIFQKYSMQKLLPEAARILYQESIPEDSFYTRSGGGEKKVRVGCVFTILTALPIGRNKRIKDKPPIEHGDFTLYQYNNTKQALKQFDNEFDIAIFNQGYGAYPTIKTRADDCDKKKHWLLVKAKNKKVIANIKKIDFTALANKNTTVKGFRKADFVSEYTRVYGQ